MTYPKVVYVEAVLMENGELIHYGKSLGFCSKEQIELIESGASKLTKDKEPIVSVSETGVMAA